MSGRKHKALRKLQKELEEKHMNPNQPRQINIIAELEQYVLSYETLTGEKPKSIELVDAMYNMYVQAVQRNAEAFGLNPGFKSENPTFMGVTLLKKSPPILTTN